MMTIHGLVYIVKTLWNGNQSKSLDFSSTMAGQTAQTHLKTRFGAVHKVRHARGGGVREGVTVCDRGRGSRACDVTLIQIFIIHMKHEIMKFKVMFNVKFCCNRCIVTEGGTDKNQPGQNPLRTIEIEFVQRTFVRDFCTRPKN